MVFLLLTALVGATLILVRSVLFRPLQRLYPPLFTCCQCTGFWVGAIGGAVGILRVPNGILVSVFVAGCATSVASLVVDAVLINLLGDPDQE